ncbi:MAG: nucleotidyltransferase domain-containing protein [Cytophagales bacterium]|nr:nucleotidyltransferase domain-containing protein [Cytophagales bacterium]
MKFGLPDAFIEVVKSFGIAHPEINQILLFGSRATGVFKNGSDVDPVLIGNELTKDHVIQFEHKLETPRYA